MFQEALSTSGRLSLQSTTARIMVNHQCNTRFYCEDFPPQLLLLKIPLSSSHGFHHNSFPLRLSKEQAEDERQSDSI